MIGTTFQKPLESDYVQKIIEGKDGNPSTTEREPNPAPNTLSRYAEAAAWCNENGAMIEDKGDYYEVVKVPEPTEEEIQSRFVQAIQQHLDSKAQELHYDSCLSVCSYINTGVAKFDEEGKAFRAWRSAVWSTGYAILADVQAGTREVPSVTELLSELPELTITYSETN